MKDQFQLLRKDNEASKVITTAQNNTLIKIKNDLAHLYNENSELKSQNLNNF